MMLYQETLKPDKDVQFIVEQYHTGRFCPRPPLYVNYFHGAAMGIYYINKYKYKNIPFLPFFFFSQKILNIFRNLYLFYIYIYIDKLFGVSLEEYAQIHKVVVPPLISQGLSAIESSK